MLRGENDLLGAEPQGRLLAVQEMIGAETALSYSATVSIHEALYRARDGLAMALAAQEPEVKSG